MRGVLDHLGLKLHEFWRAGQPKGYGHAGDGVDVRAALLARKDGSIDFPGQLFVGREDARPAGAVEGLVGGETRDVGVADGAGHHSGRDHAGDVGDVGQEAGTDGIGYLSEAGPVGHPGVGGVAGDDHLGLVLAGQFFDGVIVDPLGLEVDAIGDDVVELAGAVGRAAVGEVSPVEEVHAHYRAARRDQGSIDGAVGGRAGQGLDVRPDLLWGDCGSGKGFGRAAPGQRLDDVDILDPLVVAEIGVAPIIGQLLLVVENLIFWCAVDAGIGVAFGVDVLKDRAQRFAHGGRGLALGRDQDQLAPLPLGLIFNQAGDGRVQGFEAALEEI
jgi:hypothetical protein